VKHLDHNNAGEMNLPNQLTILRFIMTLIFICIMQKEGLAPKFSALIIFIAASITDYYDGYIARTQNLITDFGKIMDPIADKFLTLSAFFIFTQLQIMAIWMFCVIAMREILVTWVRLRAIKKGEVLAAEKSGKAKTTLQITVIISILLFLVVKELTLGAQNFKMINHYWSIINQGLLYVAVALTLYSGINFFINMRGKQNV